MIKKILAFLKKHVALIVIGLVLVVSVIVLAVSISSSRKIAAANDKRIENKFDGKIDTLNKNIVFLDNKIDETSAEDRAFAKAYADSLFAISSGAVHDSLAKVITRLDSVEAAIKKLKEGKTVKKTVGVYKGGSGCKDCVSKKEYEAFRDFAMKELARKDSIAAVNKTVAKAKTKRKVRKGNTDYGSYDEEGYGSF